MAKTVFLLLLLFGVLFADIGPSPEPPQVSIQLTEAGNPYSGSISISYVCSVPNENSDTGPMGQRAIELSCSNGICTNEGWFYKLNPCFSGSQGYFSYEWKEDNMSTDDFALQSSNEYGFELELSDASLASRPPKKKEAGFCLAPGLLAIFLLGLVFTRSWQ